MASPDFMMPLDMKQQSKRNALTTIPPSVEMTQILVKANKKEFWRQMRTHLGEGEWGQQPYEESTPDGKGGLKIARMTLYYQDGRHVGTWQSGKGWYSSE